MIVDRFTTTLLFDERFTLEVGFYRQAGDGPWENLALPGDTGTGAELGAIVVE